MHRQNSPFIMLVHVDSAHLAWPHAKSVNQQIAPINQLLKQSEQQLTKLSVSRS